VLIQRGVAVSVPAGHFRQPRLVGSICGHRDVGGRSAEVCQEGQHQSPAMRDESACSDIRVAGA
jgi:hypothetical protein